MIQRQLHRLSAAEAAAGIARRDFTATALAEACLARVADRDPTVKAWVDLDPDRFLAEARSCDAESPRGPLHGVPVAVKDIIDTADYATERGSRLFAGRRAGKDAACVDLLRGAGAIVMGKAVTTEFAYFAPGPTANPHDPRHTPGGSSSGSAAAVADFQVPFALGSQTAGSVIRPAAFTGVVGFKPSHGMFSLDGVLPLAPSLDTLGLFCRHPRDIALIASVLTAGDRFLPVPSGPTPRVVLLRTPYWSLGEGDMHAAVESFAERLRSAGFEVRELDSPAFEGLAELQNSLLASECQETLGALVASDPGKVRRETRQLLELGRNLDEGFRDELAIRRRSAEDFLRQEVFSRSELILTPSAVGSAPEGLDATGDPLFNRIWTLLGLPCASLPIGRGDRGLPLAVQVVGPADGDEGFAAACCALWPHTGYQIRPPGGEEN